jgi:putative transposase
LQLLRERLACASPETVRRALHRLGFRWRRPRPVPPEKDSEEQIEEKRARLEDVLRMSEEAAGAFLQDETKLQTNPKVGLCWMRRGRHRRLKTPGTNRKVWISGALNFRRGRLHWVWGERRDGELFVKLLDHLRRI